MERLKDGSRIDMVLVYPLTNKEQNQRAIFERLHLSLLIHHYIFLSRIKHGSFNMIRHNSVCIWKSSHTVLPGQEPFFRLFFFRIIMLLYMWWQDCVRLIRKPLKNNHTNIMLDLTYFYYSFILNLKIS